MIDLAPYAAPAIAAAFGLVGGGLLFLGTRKPKPEEEFSDADRQAIAAVRAKPPRFYVDAYCPYLYDREDPTFGRPYSSNSTANRAARRLNAKDEIARKAEAEPVDCPPGAGIETLWGSPR